MEENSGRGAMWGLLALVVAIGLMGSALAGGSALAAKGGNGHGHFSLATATATCAVTPDPTSQWELNTISGSGFPADGAVSISVRSESGDIAVGGANTDSTGSFSTTWQGVWLGTNMVTVGDNGHEALATCTFQVV